MTKQQNDCAPSEDLDQSGHPPSLIRVFAVRSMGVAKDPSFLRADSEDSDQTGVLSPEAGHIFFQAKQESSMLATR